MSFATPFLSLRNFGVAFGEHVVLHGISLELATPGLYVVMGPVGTGKSTLLRTIAGINHALPAFRSWGEASLKGAPLGAENGVALVAQNARLMMASVMENILNDFPERHTLTLAAKREVAQRLLTEAGLGELQDALNRPVVELPLAVQRHLAVARTAAAEPVLLCVDEPTANLEWNATLPMLHFLKEQGKKRAVLVVSHNQDDARELDGLTVLLAGGSVQACAPAQRFFSEPASGVAADFVRTGSCVVPSPNARPEEVDESMLPLLPVLLFPWLLWPSLWSRVIALKREGLDNGLRFCLAWMAPVFLAFSLISGKQVHYLVPLFPAFALFVGHQLARGKAGAVWLPALLAAAVGGTMLYFSVAGLPGSLGIWGELPWWPGLALLVAAAATIWAGKPESRRLQALAILGASLFALVQFYIAPGAARSYDMHPMANAIKNLQLQGIPVANLGRYHAQFQFAGRLARPLVQLGAGELAAWLEKNPRGAVVIYISRKRELPESLFSQPYRGETAVLLSADQIRMQPQLLDGRRGKTLKLPQEDEE